MGTAILNGAVNKRNWSRITTKIGLHYQMVWQLLDDCPNFKVCLFRSSGSEINDGNESVNSPDRE
jgi:hypothetical protein